MMDKICRNEKKFCQFRPAESEPKKKTLTTAHDGKERFGEFSSCSISIKLLNLREKKSAASFREREKMSINFLENHKNEKMKLIERKL